MTITKESARGTVSPKDGGCWFCHKTLGKMVYSGEFDTNLHEDCLDHALKVDPNNPEAAIIKNELNRREGVAPFNSSLPEQTSFMDKDSFREELSVNSASNRGSVFRTNKE